MTDIEKVAELVRLGADPSFNMSMCFKIDCCNCTFYNKAKTECTLRNINKSDAKKLLPIVKQTFPEYFI